MHPYIAYQILNNPANHHEPRPDECHVSLRDLLALAWRRLTRTGTAPSRRSAAVSSGAIQWRYHAAAVSSTSTASPSRSSPVSSWIRFWPK
jgi:hypothetical protein